MADGSVSPAVTELIDAVKALKEHLGPSGHYSIGLASREPMGWGEVLVIGNVIERIDIAIVVAAQQVAEADRAAAGWACPGCGQVYSPYVSQCSVCRPRTFAGNTSAPLAATEG